jgi:hypothetical protein
VLWPAVVTHVMHAFRGLHHVRPADPPFDVEASAPPLARPLGRFSGEGVLYPAETLLKALSLGLLAPKTLIFMEVAIEIRCMPNSSAVFARSTNRLLTRWAIIASIYDCPPSMVRK